jgi:putative ABC transport system permease protein
MNTGSMIRQALRLLGAHKGKTFLMMLGPAVGVACLTVVLGVVEASGRKMGKRVRTFGAGAINVIAGDATPPPDLDVTTLTLGDARAIEREVEGVRSVASALQRRGMDLEHEGKYTRAAVFGVTENWQPSWRWKISRGRPIQKRDLLRKARICVVGQSVKEKLFGGADPLGKTIRVGKINFRVVGELAKRGASPCGGDMDNRINIPLSTMMRRVANVDHIAVIRVLLEDRSKMSETAADIRTLLRKRHHINPPEPDDFGVVTPKLIGKMASEVSSTLETLLIVVAAVCLLGGGVVVMNIMLMAVSERQSEIGIRRAVGASQADIRAQFLAESVLATAIGGLGGVVLGLAVSYLLAGMGAGRAAVSWVPFVAGPAVSVVVGGIFGLLPAQRAARLLPVEALRD